MTIDPKYPLAVQGATMTFISIFNKHAWAFKNAQNIHALMMDFTAVMEAKLEDREVEYFNITEQGDGDLFDITIHLHKGYGTVDKYAIRVLPASQQVIISK